MTHKVDMSLNPTQSILLVFKLEQVHFTTCLRCLICAGCVANSIEPDQMTHSFAFDLGVHYLLGHICSVNPIFTRKVLLTCHLRQTGEKCHYFIIGQ